MRSIVLLPRPSVKGLVHDPTFFLTGSNTVQSMRVLVEGAASMGIPLEPEMQPHAEAIMNAPPQIEDDVLPRDLATAVRELWADEGVQEAFDKRSHLQLNDSAG